MGAATEGAAPAGRAPPAGTRLGQARAAAHARTARGAAAPGRRRKRGSGPSGSARHRAPPFGPASAGCSSSAAAAAPLADAARPSPYTPPTRRRRCTTDTTGRRGGRSRPCGPRSRICAWRHIADLALRAQELGDVIPLWYGEGDLITPAFIREAAKAALDAGLTFHIPDMRGHPPLVEALAEYQSALHGIPFGTDRSTVTPGGMQAVHLAMTAIAEAGRNVVFPEPQWPNIANAIHLSGAEARGVPMAWQNGRWQLDLDRLFAACDARTRAIIFSSPANPTGWVASEAELRALLDFSRRRGVWIIADEVYARLYFRGRAAPSILPLADPEDLVMTVNSLSKAWAMTGWRVGWLTHPPSIAARIGAMVQYMNSGTAGCCRPPRQWRCARARGWWRRSAPAPPPASPPPTEILGDHPAVELPARPEGGMYVFFRLRGVEDARQACRTVLEKAHVGLARGICSARPGGVSCACASCGRRDRCARRWCAWRRRWAERQARVPAGEGRRILQQPGTWPLPARCGVIRPRLFALLFLLLAVAPAPAGATTMREAEAAIAAAYAEYRAALFCSNQNDRAGTEAAIDAFAAAWSRLAEAWHHSPPPQYAKDPEFPATVDRVGRIAARGARLRRPRCRRRARDPGSHSRRTRRPARATAWWCSPTMSTPITR